MPSASQTAIVTGAASGIGRAMALGLLDAGIDVAAVDRTAPLLETLAAEAQGKPGAVQTIAADLADPASFDRIVSAVLGKSGRIDILVNNAGIGQAAIRADRRANPLRFWEVAPEQWQRFVAVNATAPIMMTRAVLRSRCAPPTAVASSPSPPASAPWCARATCCTAPARPRRRRRWPGCPPT